MTRHKFLAKGRFGPISGVAWPAPAAGAPGAWVVVEGPLVECACGVHVCRPSDLAHWINDELWELEVGGVERIGQDCVIVSRARLLRRIDAWALHAGSFAAACVDHAGTRTAPASSEVVRALVDDARMMAEHGFVAMCAYTAAVAVSRAGSDRDVELAYGSERAWQSAWIADELLALRTIEAV